MTMMENEIRKQAEDIFNIWLDSQKPSVIITCEPDEYVTALSCLQNLVEVYNADHPTEKNILQLATDTTICTIWIRRRPYR